MSVGLPETYEVGGGPIDPEDYLEYEDRQEVLRSMARLMDDEPQDDQPEPEPPPTSSASGPRRSTTKSLSNHQPTKSSHEKE